MSDKEKTIEDFVRDLKWKEFTLRVDHHKYYLNLALQVNAFFYLTTGGVLGFYLKYSIEQPTNAQSENYPLLFFLLLPILFGSVFGGIFIYGGIIQRKALDSLNKIIDDFYTESVEIDEVYDAHLLHPLFWVFGMIFLLVVIALASVPYFIPKPLPSNFCLFVILAIVIGFLGFAVMPALAYWQTSKFCRRKRPEKKPIVVVKDTSATQPEDSTPDAENNEETST